MTASPQSPKSPDAMQLRKKPNIGPRLGGRAVLIAIAVMVALGALLVFNVESRKQEQAAKPAKAAAESEARLKADTAAADAFNRLASDAVTVNSAPPTFTAARTPDLEGAGGAPLVVPPVDGLGGASVDLAESESDRAARERRENREMELVQERERRETDARRQATKVQGWGGSSPSSSAPAAPQLPAGLNASMPDLNALAQMAQAQPGMGLPGSQQKPDQERKRAFVESNQEIQPPILQATRMPPRSPYELKTGHVIPAVMLRGINSDLPGEVTGMVTENVYDSATGRYLLIPAWTKLFGTYDSEVTYGQKRALVVWTRLVYPDGSTLELGGMQGADQAGYSGFRDKVDNHYGRLIGFSLMSSVMSAGLQLSQPDSTREDGQMNNRQVVAAEVAREISQLGVEIARRNLNVQPTLRVRPGYRFTVTVNRDVAFAGAYVTK